MIVTVISILLLLLLIFTGLTVPDPPIESGIPISFGTDLQGDGDVQPEEVSVTETEVTPEETVESNPTPVETEEVMTQDAEETIVVPDETSNEEQEIVDPDPEPVLNPKAIYPGKSSNNSSNDSQGNTGEPGDQGSPDGADKQNYTGSNIPGDKFNLSGRKMVAPPSSSYDSPETGKVVVNIWVDRSGKVTRATPGAKGSTTTSSYLYKLSKAEALKTKFSANSKAPEEQKGTMVFEYKSGQ